MPDYRHILLIKPSSLGDIVRGMPTCQCLCRKASNAMVEREAEDMGINLLQAYVLGDQSRDVQLACRIGAKSLLVRTGLTSRQAVADCTALQFYSNNIAVSLTEATECIFSDLPGIRQSSSFGHWCETRDLAEELIPDGDYPVGLL